MDEKEISNLDMFKVVEEIEKQKANSIEDIYSKLDSIKDDTSLEEPKKKIEIKETASTISAPIKKPVLPNINEDFDTRFELFKYLIENVNYPNNSDYVSGHKDALGKYYKDAYQNNKDLYITEARLNDEINKYERSEGLYSKGYYDGLFYILKALKKSKDLIMKKINDELSKALDNG